MHYRLTGHRYTLSTAPAIRVSHHDSSSRDASVRLAQTFWLIVAPAVRYLRRRTSESYIMTSSSRDSSVRLAQTFWLIVAPAVRYLRRRTSESHIMTSSSRDSSVRLAQTFWLIVAPTVRYLRRRTSESYIMTSNSRDASVRLAQTFWLIVAPAVRYLRPRTIACLYGEISAASLLAMQSHRSMASSSGRVIRVTGRHQDPPQETVNVRRERHAVGHAQVDRAQGVFCQGSLVKELHEAAWDFITA